MWRNAKEREYRESLKRRDIARHDRNSLIYRSEYE